MKDARAEDPTPDLSQLRPGRVALLGGKPGRFVFVPGSRPDYVAGYRQVEAEGSPGCARRRVRPRRG